MTEPFEVIAARLDYPMVVVTAATGSGRSGCLVGFSSQCSLDPLRYMVWISKANHTHPVALEASHLGIHFLSVEDEALAALFGQETGDEVDKFEHCAWAPGPHGIPVLSGCGRWICGEVIDRLDTGDHTGFLVRPVDGRAEPGRDQLGFQQTRDLDAGHPA